MRQKSLNEVSCVKVVENKSDLLRVIPSVISQFDEIVYDMCNFVKDLIRTSFNLVDLCADMIHHPYYLLKISLEVLHRRHSIFFESHVL